MVEEFAFVRGTQYIVPYLPRDEAVNFKKINRFGERGFYSSFGGGSMSISGGEGDSDNGNQKRGQFGLKQIFYTIVIFFREVTFMFTLQENTDFIFTLLVLKELNVNSSLRD